MLDIVMGDNQGRKGVQTLNVDDRLTRGFLAGLVAGLAMNLINLPSYYLGIGKLRYLDWAATVIYGRLPQTQGEAVFAQIAQIIFVGILGIIFAYLLPLVTDRNHLLKGWVYGALIWFSLYAITLLFKERQTIPLDLATAVSDFVGATVFGLVLAATLRWTEEKVTV